MKYYELDTPSLLIGQEIMEKNLKKMQNYADTHKVSRKARRETSVSAKRRTLHFAQIARDNGFDISTVSIAPTPSLSNGLEIFDVISKIPINFQWKLQ